jgi:hypothetical protein
MEIMPDDLTSWSHHDLRIITMAWKVVEEKRHAHITSLIERAELLMSLDQEGAASSWGPPSATP